MTALNDLTDVTISSPAVGHVLVCVQVSPSESWENKTADDAGLLSTTGDQTISGVKTFTTFPVTPSSAPQNDFEVANKKYVDDLQLSELADVTISGLRPGQVLCCVGGDTFRNVSLSRFPLMTTNSSQVVTGQKKFTRFLVTPNAAPRNPFEVANKQYVDDHSTLSVQDGGGEVSVSAEKLKVPRHSLVDKGSGEVELWLPKAGLYGLEVTVGRATLYTGTHTGNAADERDLTDWGFRPVFGCVKGEGATYPFARFLRRGGVPVGYGAMTANEIIRTHPDGITLGTGANTNANGVDYWDFGFGAAAVQSTGVRLVVGTYTGDGSSSRSLSDWGIGPVDMAWIKRDGAYGMVFKTNQHPDEVTSYLGQSTADIATGAIKSLDDKGVTLGSHANVNASGATYYYVGFQQSSGGSAEIVVGEYNIGITTCDELFIPLPWSADLIVIKSLDYAYDAIFATSAMTMPLSLVFRNLANITNGVTKIESDGFWVGTGYYTQSAHTRLAFFAMKA